MTKGLRISLWGIAVLGFGVSWWLYPQENRFSILRCTISFLGSPDSDRNPEGWRWYQVGMTALIVLLVEMVRQRHRNFLSAVGERLRWSTAIYLASLFLVLCSTWIADTDQYWYGFRVGTVHTRVAIIGIFTMMAALIVDAGLLKRAGFGGQVLWPFRVYGIVWIAAMIALGSWEWKCRRDPSLKRWPGDGIHSTPLWEWILFSCLLAFMIWVSRPGTARRVSDGGDRVGNSLDAA